MWQEDITVHFRALTTHLPKRSVRNMKKSELSVTLPRFETDIFRMQVRRVTPCSLTDVHKRVFASLHHHEDGGSWLL
jgi:hypothetical protein